ncbi:hypothetical protein BK687P2_00028 [Bacteroides phage BK687P2]|nr:hypothetical protein BK687P2_00028 [Bacteroides phage BK687P2]
MGLKKYEIITVGSDKRVRALRSWQVGDRYVNIGDVGGIVYDEKTLSQDGACWLFSGNFGFPGARIGGDSIVDVGEAAIDANGSANVDILGSSVVVGSKVNFTVATGAVDGLTLSEADFEQGGFSYAAGVNWEDMKTSNPNIIRTKSPIFAGGAPMILKCNVAGYNIQAFRLDRDGVSQFATAPTNTGEGVTLAIPACQYFVIRVMKNPAAAITPADATAARITFTGDYETKLSVIDSRLEINPVSSTGTVSIRSGGLYSITPGATYPDSVIRNSKVVINGHATANRTVRLISDFTGCNVVIDATLGDSQGVGVYSNVKNLTFTGAPVANWNVAARSIIQATDCNDFAVSPTIFPGLATAQTANMPFIFQGCNVPNGIFYHHAQIANTYKNIDFVKAQADLGKIVSGRPLVSSEVKGMYRYVSATGAMGPLIEAYDSVKSLNMANAAGAYGTTIYKDAYFNGLFDIAGTNVFGNKVRSHPLAQVLNVQPRAVRGGFNTTTTPPTVVPEQLTNTVMNVPLRINGANGLNVENVPAGVRYMYVILDANLKFVQNSTWKTGTSTIEAALLRHPYAMIQFNRESGDRLTPADLAGVTVTVYNGCKIMNTGATAVNMKGNIRVEDNATLVNAGVVGSGYFGGNSVVYYNPAVWAALECTGLANMKDNAVFAPTALAGACALVHMEGNAKFIGSGARTSTELSFIMRDNAIIEGVSNTRSGVVMSGNARVTSTGVIAAASRGALVMTDNASIEAATTVIGAITLAGNYKGNVVKTWVGKRTITDVNEPEYDNNVKTQYDF